MADREPPPPPLRPRRTALGAVRIGARALVGTIGIGVAAAAIAAATWLPLPVHAPAPPSMLVTPTGASQQRVCAGPALQLANALDAGASDVTSSGRPSVKSSSRGGTAVQALLAHTDNQAGLAPAVLTLPPGSGAALAGSQSQSVATGDLAGFGAAECAEAAGETWLVGGATDTGRTTLITLANPGLLDATVSLAIFTEAGEVHATGTDGIVVAAGTQRILPLAGFAPDAVSAVVRVRSEGGHVVANLQQSVIRTLAPGGIAIVGASAAPATRAVIPGVVFSGSEAVAGAQSRPGFADLAPILRLYVPGDSDAKVGISIVPEDGSAPGEPVSLSVPGGVVTDVPLEVGDGDFTIEIAADVPIVAAARVSVVGSSGAIDLSWFAAAPELHRSAQLAIAPGPAPALHLANPTAKDAVVTLQRHGGASRTVTVRAHASTVVPVSSGGYGIDGFDTLRAAVSYRGNGAIGGFTVSPAARLATPIRVYP
jgi:hypothetical protein